MKSAIANRQSEMSQRFPFAPKFASESHPCPSAVNDFPWWGERPREPLLLNFRFPLSAFLLPLFLVAWLAPGLSRAATPAANPYEPIVTRNVFNLVPIPAAPPPGSNVPDKPLPKIVPNGIMTIFGKLQVLFKVSQPGQPAGKEQAYMMSEGERQDEIEVQKIDEPAATITFNNNGTVQTLALVEGKATGGAAPAAGPGGVPRLPAVPGAVPAHGPIASHGGFGRSTRPMGANPSAAPEASPGLGGTASAGVNTQAKEPAMTPEEQVIMIEANRMVAKEKNDGTAPLFPITPMTSEATGDGSGDAGTPANPK